MGWVENSPKGTVRGIIQGNPAYIEDMKHWLSEEGSPKSEIKKCVFSGEKTIVALEFPNFMIHHVSPAITPVAND